MPAVCLQTFLFFFSFFFFNFQRTVVLYVLHRKHYFPSSHPSLFDLGVHCPVNHTWSPQDNLHTSTSPPTKRPTLLGNPPGTECFKAASIVFQPSLTVQSMGSSLRKTVAATTWTPEQTEVQKKGKPLPLNLSQHGLAALVSARPGSVLVQ